ncbi:hypothetical protein AGLY_007339 [Aphis glycines]|uniref:Uncharacterized protein n=1 Tax=Aphis glycines TaxID=307491 RepID=A0A6G0TRL0_APHGL|nr:hypothetical protein AGLY_007339 [Aphis glycines]
MSSSRDTPQCKDSSSNLLKLFNGGRSDHRVVTRQDLITDYSSNDDDNNNSPRSSTSDNAVAINNYYTWNSSRTNSPIHKERAQIISALHSVKSTSELCRGLTNCDGYNRAHRIKEIMSMCADRRGDFSADEYHHHDHPHHDHGNEQDPTVTESDAVTTALLTDGATSNRRSWTSSYLGGASLCWSSTAIDRETEDDYNDNGNENNVNAEEEHCRRTSKRQLSWFRKLNRKFRKSRDSR